MSHLFVIANSILIILVGTFFIYAAFAAVIFGEWHQLLFTTILLVSLIVLQVVLTIIAES